MDAKYINRSCIEAVRECPGRSDFCEYEDETELFRGNYWPIPELHKLGATKVVQYWSTTEGIGGSILWGSGYYKELPQDVLDLFLSLKASECGTIKEALHTFGVTGTF